MSIYEFNFNALNASKWLNKYYLTRSVEDPVFLWLKCNWSEILKLESPYLSELLGRRGLQIYATFAVKKTAKMAQRRQKQMSVLRFKAFFELASSRYILCITPLFKYHIAILPVFVVAHHTNIWSTVTSPFKVAQHFVDLLKSLTISHWLPFTIKAWINMAGRQNCWF